MRELILRHCPMDLSPVVIDLLDEECSVHLPAVKPEWTVLIERIQASVIRRSAWQVPSIRKGVDRAKSDWRDLLVAAGFAHDLDEHGRWIERALETGNIE
jgi:hypothetical protein